jgi:hypothetical protein
MRIDHAVLAVRDLDTAADGLTARTGLASVPGGRHPRWGTANRIVPLGEDYIELLAVTDPGIAEASVLGRALMELTAHGADRWFALCVADDEIEATAARLGMTVEPGRRTLPDGSEVAWRGAGIEDPDRPRWLPFFIAWDVPPGRHPGRSAADHRLEPVGIARVEVAGDAGAWSAWVGGSDLPMTFDDPAGDPAGLRAVVVGLADGTEIRLDGS